MKTYEVPIYKTVFWYLAKTLHYICNISLKIVVFPEEMKNIRVTTLFKEGEVCGFGNYCLSFV